MSDLVDLLLGLLSRDDPRRLGERLLDLAVTRYNARRAALFVRERDRCVLFLARKVDQEVLDAVREVWTSRREALTGGRVLAARAGQGPKELRSAIEEPSPARSAALAPVVHQRELVGLLYVDTAEARFETADDLEGLKQLARVAGVALTSPSRSELPAEAVSSYLESMPADTVARDQLKVQLERHNWNISRVARGLGITRATVYQRLARFGIPRPQRT